MTTSIPRFEVIQPRTKLGPPQLVVFDFDGTLSLIREGWQRIMIEMMMGYLLPLAQDETEESIRTCVVDFVTELTGKPTILQMVQLVEEMRKRGGSPESPEAYKAEFQSRLDQHIEPRRQALANGSHTPDEHLVPGVREMLRDLAQRNIPLAVASGTDEEFVKYEIELLQIAHYFAGRVFAAPRGDANFSKLGVIQRLIEEFEVEPSGLIGFGDGYAETEAVSRLGGIAIGIAGDELTRDGTVDQWRRERLIAAGAEVVMPDFRDYQRLHDWLWDATSE